MEVKVPDIGDFKDVPVISILVACLLYTSDAADE